MTGSQANGHSAKVTATLRVGHRDFEVASVGPNSCRLRCPDEVPPSDAVIIVSLDGIEKSQSVFLVDGIAADRAEVRFDSHRSATMKR
jgi:hypothetical protein